VKALRVASEAYKVCKGFLSHRRRLKESSMEAFGYDISGQGYMIEGYKLTDQERFKRTLFAEIQYAQQRKGRKEIEILDVGANLGFYSLAYASYPAFQVHLRIP
jgi:hypothetical protein